ncbi:MAG: hypothetical protein HYX42_01575 [Polaromonas sp.]|uniref:hypothetical protein n=1 Tax=Polaromonas sp. TaxID=1869339 RepID=UPI0025F6DF92|nr:hypothetical protein [Polaromonas sp.]MBI2724917.1 hypothetical protein [Polaromonas sp.]
MVQEDDIGMELVLLLRPDVLESAGGQYTCQKSFRVKGDHFFLCYEADDEIGNWLPLYSNPGFGRIAVSTQGRRGHPKWVEGVFYYDPKQIWTAKHSAVVAAANAAGDLSRAGNRNTIGEEHFPPV